MITIERLKELLNYDPETGVLMWIKKSSIASHVKIGTIAGSLTTEGYLRIVIDYKSYMAHRLAWLYVHGVWPTFEIDHKDTVKHHNWIDNLRDVTKAGNMQNKIKAQSSNKTGLLGVHFHKASGKYLAQIRIPGEVKYLGLFKTPEDAHVAYLAAKREHHSTCTI